MKKSLRSLNCILGAALATLLEAVTLDARRGDSLLISFRMFSILLRLVAWGTEI